MSTQLNIDSGNTYINNRQSIVTARIGDQTFGFPIASVSNAIRLKQLTAIPRARREVSGVTNLRGRVVTVISMRRLLCLPDTGKPEKYGIVSSCDNEWYSLLFDSIGDVLPEEILQMGAFSAKNKPEYATIATGIASLSDKIIILLSVSKIFDKIRAN